MKLEPKDNHEFKSEQSWYMLHMLVTYACIFHLIT